MTSDSIRPPEKRYGYRNAVVGVINLIREENFRGLARGIGPNTVRGFLFFIYFLFFKSLFTVTLLGTRNAVECVILSLFHSLSNII